MNTNALIPVFAGTLQDQPVQLCNARDLHIFLQVGKEFANWIKDRIEQYGFVEGEDYLPNLANRSGGTAGRKRTDYHLTLDMAKELGMLENNEQGRQIRRYFIRVEKEKAATLAPKAKALPQKTTAITAVTEEFQARINKRAWELAGKLFDEYRVRMMEDILLKSGSNKPEDWPHQWTPLETRKDVLKLIDSAAMMMEAIANSLRNRGIRLADLVGEEFPEKKY